MTSPDQNYTSWRTDIDAAPRGKMVTRTHNVNGGPKDVQVFVPDRIFLATKCGKVTISQFMPKEDRWEMLAAGEQPVAWMPWPEHPAKAKKVRA